MGQIQRPWLRRIGGYVPSPGSGPESQPHHPGKPVVWDDADDDASSRAFGPPTAPQGDEVAANPYAVPADPVQPAEPADASEATNSAESGDSTENADSPSCDPASSDPGNPDLTLSIPEAVRTLRREAETAGRSPWNRHQAVRAFPLEGRYLRGLATRFARMVAKLAEDHADLPTDGDEEWDLNALVRRRFTGRLPHQCRMSREKRKVVVVLDTSPSCEHQARLFGAVAQIAEGLGDCEIYDAPNFQLTTYWKDGTWQTVDSEAQRWQFRNRVVLAFGDFDGIERISTASQRRGNRIYWFCCEERTQVMEMQRERFVHDYKGHYFPATHLNALMRAMRRVR